MKVDPTASGPWQIQMHHIPMVSGVQLLDIRGEILSVALGADDDVAVVWVMALVSDSEFLRQFTWVLTDSFIQDGWIYHGTVWVGKVLRTAMHLIEIPAGK